MKTKLLLSVLALVCCLGSVSLAQDKAKAKSEKSITWYGVDFTVAKFSLVVEDPSVIVNQYLKQINLLVQTEQTKFDLRKWFNKTDVSYKIDQSNERNAAIDPAGLVITDQSKITLDDVKRVLANYKTESNPGIGLIMIAENLHKVNQTASFYVVFFDQSTKEIIDAERYEAKAVGIGFRNYWAGSIYNIMKIWLK
jgi:hypothetical protein